MEIEAEGSERQLALEMIAIYKRYTGRGPTHVECTITDSFACVFLMDGLTKGERTLTEEGRGEMVGQMRRDFQRVMREDMRDVVQQLTGRTTRSFLSDHDVEQDVAVEVFVFDRSSSGD